MSMTCKICRHEARREVEEELLKGTPLRTIAIQYRVSHSALQRHKANDMLIVDEDGAKVVWRLQDVIDVPRSIKERAELIDALLERALEPLTRSASSSAIRKVPMGFVIQLLKLQQADELVILKATGFFKDDRDEKPVHFSMMPEYQQFMETVEATLLELAGGDRERSGKLRLELADAIDPRSDLPKGRETVTNVPTNGEEVMAPPTDAGEPLELGWDDDDDQVYASYTTTGLEIPDADAEADGLEN